VTLHATVLICSYNRSTLLAETLDSLALTAAPDLAWEVIVVDNNSTDDTRTIVTERIPTFPVRLKYVFEARQGKSNALNVGIAASDATVIVFTDDDVRVGPGWLAAACEPLLADGQYDYTGGPVFPIWESPRPSWLAGEPGDLWGTLAILDYGSAPFCFEERQRIPVGANMAVRRELINRIGGFAPDLDRTGRSLLGQGQAEFFCRSRAVGARGLYVPGMPLEHHVPSSRLTLDYFRRWWYWKGISRFRLEQMHPTTELGVDITKVGKVFGVPKYMYRTALQDVWGWTAGCLTGDAASRVRHEFMLCYFAGYAREAAARTNASKPLMVPSAAAEKRDYFISSRS
jgi:glycosyltransferase involved in cell wall biosynthesis